MARVLIVDDSVFQRKKICRMLEESGYQICQAEDGEGISGPGTGGHIGCPTINERRGEGSWSDEPVEYTT